MVMKKEQEGERREGRWKEKGVGRGGGGAEGLRGVQNTFRRGKREMPRRGSKPSVGVPQPPLLTSWGHPSVPEGSPHWQAGPGAAPLKSLTFVVTLLVRGLISLCFAAHTPPFNVPTPAPSAKVCKCAPLAL